MSDTAPRIHPDDCLALAFLTVAPGEAKAIRYDTEVFRMAAECPNPKCRRRIWNRKETTGHGASKRQLPEPIFVCASPDCGAEWPTWTESIARSVADKASRRPWRYDQQMARLIEIGQLYQMASRMHRSRIWCWEARIYFPYVLHFSSVKASSGRRAMVAWAHTGWPRARVPWSLERIDALIQAGRAEWARRLQRAGFIESGDWWDEAETRAERRESDRELVEGYFREARG